MSRETRTPMPMRCTVVGCPRRSVDNLKQFRDLDPDRYLFGLPSRCVYHQPRALRPSGCGKVLIHAANEVRCHGGVNLCRSCGTEVSLDITTIGLPDVPDSARLYRIRRDAVVLA